MMTVRFDDSLPILVAVVRAELGDDMLREGTILRDAVGRLSFFSAQPLDEHSTGTLSEKLSRALGAYARTDRVVADSDAYGASAVREDRCALNLVIGGLPVRLVDRRLVGADWLRHPAEPVLTPPRFVFASLKGGVGRSTALAVTAAHVASHARRVLVVDLDMEAPGLGSLLLTRDTLPEFGIIDALVENGLSDLDSSFYADLVGPSELAGGGGRIDVVPALGRRSLSNPADVLAKIARAYAEDVRSDGKMASILDQVRDVIGHLLESNRYDAVLVDSRAGLHETTASAILGLGAEVFLFGLDEPQTFQGYEVMLAHLARFVPLGASPPEWVERLTMVQGKAPTDAEERRDFAERCRALFADAGLVPRPTAMQAEVRLPEEPFSNVPWDDDLPDEDVLPAEGHVRDPLAVLNDDKFRGFDPLGRRDLVSENVYRSTFGDLLARVDDVLNNASEEGL